MRSRSSIPLRIASGFLHPKHDSFTHHELDREMYATSGHVGIGDTSK